MVKHQLTRIRREKNTTDIYTKPLFLLENTLDIDKESHLELIELRIENFKYLRNLMKSKIYRIREDRMSFTARMEHIFNRALIETLVKLCKYRYSHVDGLKDSSENGPYGDLHPNSNHKLIDTENDSEGRKNHLLYNISGGNLDAFTFNLIIDYHIKYHYIDRFNKTELYLLLLPDHLSYEKEIEKLSFYSSRNHLLKKMRSKFFFTSLLPFITSLPEFFDQLLYEFFLRNGQKDFHKQCLRNFIGMDMFKKTYKMLFVNKNK